MMYVQPTLDGLDLPFPEIQQQITTFSQSQTTERGAIFTKREVVNFMLDKEYALWQIKNILIVSWLVI